MAEVQKVRRRAQEPRAEIALALQQKAEMSGQEAAQGLLAAGGRIDGVAGDLAIAGQRVHRLGEIADEAGRERGAFVRAQWRRKARLGRAGPGRLAEN